MMKRMLTLLLAALLCCGCAFALVDTDYPVWDGISAPANAMLARFGERTLALELDASPSYSFIEGGRLQVCFFASDTSGDNVLEVYLELPQALKTGELLRGGDISNCAITLYEITPDGETSYYAGTLQGAPWPERSEVLIEIDQAQSDSDALHVCGYMRAALCRMLDELPGSELISLDGAYFDFSLSRKPINSLETAPKFTLPPEYARA